MHPKNHVYHNKKYLDWIRGKECLCCGRPPRSEAHHVWNSGGKKAPNDYLTVPLCPKDHTFGRHAYHRIGHKAFEEFWNIDLKDWIINFQSEYLNERRQ